VGDPPTAGSQLERILHMLPLAAREGGATYDELAAALEASLDQVVRDLEEVTAREFYHPAGSVHDIGVGFLPDRVVITTTGHFRRPVRLSLREAAALDLGLRLLATERDDPDLPGSVRWLEEQLAWAVPENLADHVHLTGDPAAVDQLRALIIDAARDRRRCRIRYLKPDATGPDERRFDPYVVVYGEGVWYAIGQCHERGERRIFRVDRILEAERLEETFDPPADFDPGDFISGGRVFRADEETEVTVRYAPAVARWVLEEGLGEAQPDGSVVVRHTVVDPGWIVRHVLQHGPDAQVLDPPDFRDLVRHAARGILRTDAHPDAPVDA
jgi:predicted DNA-binding transcriptional regulator YafY